jgi:autotransporter-associated beta strand protein
MQGHYCYITPKTARLSPDPRCARAAIIRMLHGLTNLESRFSCRAEARTRGRGVLLPIESNHRRSIPRGARLRSHAAALLASSALLLAAFPAAAQDATWNNPATVAGPVAGTFDFNANANWTNPATVPTGTAFFSTSSTTALSFSANTTIGGWTFNAGASNYAFTNGHIFAFAGAGIVINGGSATITNNFGLHFFNTSTAGSATITNNSGLAFHNTSTAGSAIITNNAFLNFVDTSTAGSATIANNNDLEFFNASTAGSAAITNNAVLFFNTASTAGSAIITNNAFLNFVDTSTAGSATITTNSGGSTGFLDTSTGGTARFITNVGGAFDMSGLAAAGMTAGSIEGAGSYFLGANALTVGSNNLSTTVSGVVSDCGPTGTECLNAPATGGSLIKVGTGTLTLSGTNTYTGNTTVNGGSLLVNGSIAASALTAVNAGGTLGGTGIVGNTVINGGTLSPGNSIGTLTVQGSLVFTTAATYMVEVSSANASLTNVTGPATLAGTVQVTSPTSSFRFNSPYTILTSAGLGGTQFNSLSTPAGTTGSLIYSGNNVLLDLTSSLGQLPGLNINQHNVATALDAGFNAPGSTQTGALGAIFTGNVPLNLTQASGEVATGSQQTTFDAMNLFMGVMTDPFISGRGDGASSAAGATTFAEEDDSASAYADGGKPRSKSERDAYVAIYRKAPTAEPFAQRWSVWAAGFGGSQTTDGNAMVGSNTATSRIAGGAVGADYRFSPFTLAGFAIAGGGTNFSLANGLGTGRSDLFQAGAFVRHNAGPAYISAALAYGWQDITTDRNVTIAGIDRLHAEFNANAFSGRVEGGYRFVAPWTGGVGITPYAAGQFTTFDLPAYAEGALAGANTFALAYGSKSVTDPRSELGIRTDKSFAMRDSILTFRTRFAWAHDFNTDRNIATTFQALPGASFVVNGAAQAHDSALTTASIEMKWINGWSAAATFEGEFSKVTRSYAGKGVVRYAW